MHSLAELLHPVSVDAFFDDYFEKQPLHIQRTRSDSLIAVDDAHALIRAAAVTQPRRLRANLRGRVFVPERHYSPVELADWALRLFSSGATIVVNYIELLDLRCGRLAASLGAALGARVTFTMFMTPPGAQGFAPHFDTLDVLVLQTEGVKSWSVGEVAVHLPTPRQAYLVDYGGERPPVTQRVTMQPADVMYIPRGVVHWAAASSERSIHLTADIGTATVGEVLTAACGRSRVPAAHQRLAWLTTPPLTSDLRDVLDDVAHSADELPNLCEQVRIEKWCRKHSG